jgi:aryl-alcohol dehydrogenase-like predicted oxidoreductase
MPSDDPRFRHLPGLAAPVSRIGLGTAGWRLAGRDAAFARLDAFVTLGGTLIDTAHAYEAGESERVVGAWLASRGVRDGVTVLTKGAHPGPGWVPRMTPEAIATDLGESLERLGIECVDVLLLHRDGPAVPVGELMDALDAEVRAGRTRAVGVSNWTLGRLEAALRHVADHGRVPITASSAYLGLASPTRFPWPGCVGAHDADSLAWYASHELPLLAWSSQAGGFFADGFDPTTAFTGTVEAYVTDTNLGRRRRATELGARLGMSATQVALAWVLEQPFRPVALVGARDAAGVAAAWAGLDVRLSAAERDWLETGGGPMPPRET